jgi:hypothetical protein
MLRLLGVRLHPGLRLLLGVALIAIGLAGHRTGLLVAGAAVIVWAVIGAAGGAGRARREPPARERGRR